MSLQKLMSNYSAYNAWANGKIISFLRTKPKQTWYQEVPSSYNSIVGTLNHILATQEYWYSVITKTVNTSTRWNNESPDAEEVFDFLTRHSNLMTETFRQFSEEELSKTILIESPWFTSNLPRYEYIQQVLNHSVYHRGQVVTIGRNLGFTDAPNTDYNFYNVEMVAITDRK